MMTRLVVTAVPGTRYLVRFFMLFTNMSSYFSPLSVVFQLTPSHNISRFDSSYRIQVLLLYHTPGTLIR